MTWHSVCTRPYGRFPVMPLNPRLGTINAEDAKKCSSTESMRTPSVARKEPDARRRSLMDRVRRLLARRLSVVRKSRVIRVDLAPASGKAASRPPAAKSLVSRPDIRTDPVAKEIHQIAEELRQRLDRHALSRKVFPQLAVVEHELKRCGYRSLSTLPPELLDTASEQLVFVMGRIPGELGTLRAKLLEAILARVPTAGDFGSHLALSVFDASHSVLVADATESAFFHAEEQWAASNIGTRTPSRGPL